MLRSLFPDSEYFDYLDALRDSGEVDSVLAASRLACDFPGLRHEEARAICSDWRAARRARGKRAAR